MDTPPIFAALRVRSSSNDAWPVGSWIATADDREPVLGFGRIDPWKTESSPEMTTVQQARGVLQDLTKRYGHCASFEIVKFQEIVEP